MCSIWSAWVGGYFIKIYRESFGPRSKSAPASSASPAATATATATRGGSSAEAGDSSVGAASTTLPKRKSARAD